MRGRARAPGPAAGTTRERLIAAAAEEIVAQGYERAGIQAIARRAGLTNGAIYANFRDKSELLAEAIEVWLRRLFGRMEGARRAGATPAQVLELIGRRLALDTPDRDRRLLSEAMAAARRDPDVGVRVRELVAQLEAYMADTIAQAQADGDITADLDPATVARFATALGMGYHVFETAEVPPPPRTEWVSLMTRLIGSLRT